MNLFVRFSISFIDFVDNVNFIFIFIITFISIYCGRLNLLLILEKWSDMPEFKNHLNRNSNHFCGRENAKKLHYIEKMVFVSLDGFAFHHVRYVFNVIFRSLFVLVCFYFPNSLITWVLRNVYTHSVYLSFMFNNKFIIHSHLTVWWMHKITRAISCTEIWCNVYNTWLVLRFF